MITRKTTPSLPPAGPAKPAVRRAPTKTPVKKAVPPAASHATVARKTRAKPALVASNVTLTEANQIVRKPRPVRDSFTMSEAEYALLGRLKQACLDADYEVKKSELVRVGIALVAGLDMVALKDRLVALAPVKSGRAKKA